MSYKLIISKNAHEDIDAVVGYIMHVLCNPQAAADFLDEIESGYKRAEDNPRLYVLCHDTRLERLGYRKIVIGNYLMLYRIDEKKKTVLIVRIMYGGRNYPDML